MRQLLRLQSNRLPLIAAALGAGALVAALLVASPMAAADAPQGSPLHPVFALLDADGQNVLDSGNPVSTMETCGQCHETAFIAEHNQHAGLLTGALEGPAGEQVMVSPDSGELVALGEAAASAEVNCFLCHSTRPSNAARLQALGAGQVEWANTATLLDTGLVARSGEGYEWNRAAFAEDGTLLPDYVGIHDPSVNNCAQCHGIATTDASEPLVVDTCSDEQRLTTTTGVIFAPQRISLSGLNISGKAELTRSWDVHAERIVGCTDCHYSLNNPAYAAKPADSSPEHLVFDPRRLDPGEYLSRPVHDLARSGDDTVTQGACTSCHAVTTTHDWLPYTDRHMEALACESCHVPELEAPAYQAVDWTVLTSAGLPGVTCRGQETSGQGGQVLITGYQPVLLPRETVDGQEVIAPHNLIATWYWAYGEEAQPVALADLQAAYFDGGAYHPDVLAAFDADGDGALNRAELVIDTEAKETLVAGRLAALGLQDPRIEATTDAYPVNHGVTHGDWAIKECTECHGEDSRLAAPLALVGGNPPGGVTPRAGDGLPHSGGDIVSGDGGAIFFQPHTGQPGTGTYVFGLSRASVIDWVGVLFFLGTLLAVTVHGGLRFIAARRQAGQQQRPEVREVYMYTVYERFWHWLQMAVILLLMFTGLIIHKPEMFGIFSFRGVVLVHNVLAALLVANAALALFYHLASGQIKQFLPKPHGFFNAAIEQAMFYLKGIFEGAEHPFERTPERKMNPLQQATYLAILNVLLPAQIITGALMWAAGRWPGVGEALGGLPLLAPIHTLVAWLFASFIVGHVYLTTTGHEPLASIKGMMFGWDEVEAPSAQSAQPAPSSASK